MNAKEFVIKLLFDIYNNSDSFIRNMNDHKESEHTFCEWVQIFSAWMEWNTDECKNFHGEK